MTIIEILHPVIIAVLIALAGVVGYYLAVLVKKSLSWLEVKLGTETYNAAKEIAIGLYVYLEDKYNVSGLGETKKAEMEALLLEKFPKLTQSELDAINKEVWLSFNEEWYEETTTKRIDG